MLASSNFMKTQFLLNRAMSAESLRWKATTNNIANAETPYFKRSDVKFESQLKRALKSESPYPFKAKMTSPKHIPFHKPVDFREVTPKVHYEYDTSFNNNKNNVDIDQEMVNAAQTTLRYKSFANFMGRNFRKINTVLR